MRVLISGNEAIARGAWEHGCLVATGYPGTPSTEILESISLYKSDLYCEWAPNEKVALEVAAGASLTGARSIVTMKHVGLNVAADPFMTLSYIGPVGGMVVCVADDPGMHSSQNEQDTRHYARFAKVPVFEPADSQEACDFMGLAFEVSEEFECPVILRSTTRISHSRSMVDLGERATPDRDYHFEKNPPRYVPIPIWGRKMRLNVEERLKKLQAAAEKSPANRIEWKDDRKLGIIAVGIASQYAREVFPEASLLKLGWCYPFPDGLIREFAEGVEEVLVVEELDNFVEEHIRAMGIAVRGKDVVTPVGELSTGALKRSRALLEGADISLPSPVKESEDLPARPPVLCPGCPHRGVFYGLGRYDVVVTGDIGCYSLGVFPPLNRTDVILCMGGGVTLAHGIAKGGEKRPTVGIVGDSTFFHSGVTGLMDIAYNGGNSTIIVVDNRTTAMTGHQDHPGTGRTLMGTDTMALSIEDLGRACGFEIVETLDPYDLHRTIQVLGQCIESDKPALVVSRAPCPLQERQRKGATRIIDTAKCKNCGACLKLGCPAIESRGEKPSVHAQLCIGCGMCDQVCKFAAIHKEAE